MRATSVDSPMRGIALVTLAVLCFSVGDTTLKHLAQTLPVPTIQALRYDVMLVLLLAFFVPRLGRTLWQTRRTGLVILRAGFLATGSLVMGLALSRMPLGETVAIGYIAPLLVLVLSAPLLRETVTLPGWIGAFLGFAGVLLIIRPGGGLDPLGVGFALAYALVAAGYTLLSRLLTRTETTLSMLFYVALVGAVSFNIVGLASGTLSMPSTTEAGFIVLLSVSLMVGHFLFTAAYRAAPPALLSPFSYLHLVFAGGLGWGVFGHVPDTLSLLGMSLILASGLGIAAMGHARKRHQRRRAARASAGNGQ